MTNVLTVLRSKARRPVTVTTERNGHGRLPGRLLDYLEREFHLLPRDMLNLRSVEMSGSVYRQPARLVRIYDRLASGGSGVSVRSYTDLDKHSELILYSGYILGNGAIRLTRQTNSAAPEDSHRMAVTAA